MINGSSLSDSPLSTVYRVILVLLVASSLAPASEPCGGSTSTVVPCGFGVNIDFTDPRAGEMEMLSGAGFRWVRMDLKWDATEIEKGRYDFQAYDRLLTALEASHVRALFILDYGNPLYDDGAPPRTNQSRKAFARWAVAAARHFKGRGVLWEIYNEPNHEQFWPRPNVKEYVELAKEVGKEFREHAPGEQLIGPATAGVDFEFLESCFKAGLLDYWSAVSVHPYRRTDPETAVLDYRRLQLMIDRYRPGSNLPIIAGEWGYSATWPGLNRQKQGELLARSWLTNLLSGIPLSIWYDWKDDGVDAREDEHHFGTVAHHYYPNRQLSYDPKPAYLAARTMATFFAGFSFEKRLRAGGPNDYLLIFRKGNELRLAAWTTERARRNVKIDLGVGSYGIVNHVGQEIGRIKQGFQLNLSSAPV